MGLFGKNDTVTLRVSGMTCGNCVSHVKSALEDVVGVRRAEVDLEAESAEVTVRQGTERTLLVEAVRGAGYAAQ